MTYLRSVIETPQRLRLSLSDTADWDRDDPENRRFTLKIDEPTGGPIVLRLSGDVDVATAPILAACLDEIVLHGRSAVVDLLRTSFVGCAALTALAAAGTRIREQRSHLTVAAPQHLRRVIALADMDAVRTFDTLAHAFTAAHTATSSAYEEPPPRQTG
ncbi:MULTISPECIES: STAS domain-containing protein [unclassified Rhodococcus (in: high G+C Gram-positive bacteria)]|uniref:STAS domain-containing protein n=1 Tax=unclassified Rhodococcus (in: high G+C Gram-positive bacteria) TaxID=192944 RepID=UPI00163B2A1F|nr:MULTISPECIES: STAS domain-containing protein [unclassified Rhodococcus (in: high G+C Gram-positive bacteria)]MBC2640734.1 STAS domain-containing protein [Rhodococcus sp. 3A]MBC2894521.1 STAS domain-containing protein [Rhodococcus sp. 4CII]